ncbi:MAG: Na(+)/H(+) antiporter subunit B [Candidatus Tectomicrobia bacterium]|jgi:monovalent cation:proton antiporter|nr:Na(+)/H(+) antiporter subunit B [Candidatus Tectomicrobia bacterium]HEX2276674.1 MnhB domain-containing protein [Candidatus Tectomicrobia bacterium]
MTGSLILTTVTRLVFFVVLLFSLYLLLRGHNSPGGGFIAGVMTALGILLQSIASDLHYVRLVFRVEPRVLAGVGLMTSLTTGLVPMLLGYPFLTSTFGHVHVPGLGEVEIASAFFFDLGVYFVVVGGSLLMMITLAEE